MAATKPKYLYLRPFEFDERYEVRMNSWLSLALKIGVLGGALFSPVREVQIALACCLPILWFVVAPRSLDAPLLDQLRKSGDVYALSKKKGLLSVKNVSSDDDNWKKIVLDLLHSVDHVFFAPGTSDGTLWELDQICSESALLQKTVFLMPGEYLGETELDIPAIWSTFADRALVHGIEFPDYRRDGCAFGFDRLGDLRQFASSLNSRADFRGILRNSLRRIVGVRFA